MQKAYITALYELMENDKNVYSLLSDSGTDYDLMMFRDFPEQCFNFGIAEENKVGAASGMAAMGKIPFVYTTGAFLAYRAYEFIRDDVCFQNRNVKIVGMGSGLAVSPLGASHHTTEDISALRALPNLTLLSPASPLELSKCVKAAYEINGPVYIRMGMNEHEEFAEDLDFCIGKFARLTSGSDITIFSTGSVTLEALKAAKLLLDDGIGVCLINVHTIKPLDTEGILSATTGIKRIFTVEEHNIIGGLGGAIAEVLGEAGVAIPLTRVGLNDCFASGYGTHSQVRHMNKLDCEGIYNTIKQIMEVDKHD